MTSRLGPQVCYYRDKLISFFSVISYLLVCYLIPWGFITETSFLRQKFTSFESRIDFFSLKKKRKNSFQLILLDFYFSNFLLKALSQIAMAAKDLGEEFIDLESLCNPKNH